MLYGEVVRLKSFTISPPPDLELSTLGLEVEDTGGRRVTASHQDIAKSFIGKFKGQIFCKKQLLFFDHNGVMIHMRVSFVIHELAKVVEENFRRRQRYTSSSQMHLRCAK
nr:uncharacterized protein LOC104104283 [Nicotiana tomentosiformis]